MANSSETVFFVSEDDDHLVVRSIVRGQNRLQVFDKASPSFDENVGTELRIASRMNLDPTYVPA